MKNFSLQFLLQLSLKLSLKDTFLRRPGLIAGVFFIFIYSCLTHLAYARSFNIQIKENAFTHAHLAELSIWLKKTQELLPEFIQERIGKSISLEFKPLSDPSTFTPPLCPETFQNHDSQERDFARDLFKSHKKIYGRSFSNTIQINAAFIPEILKGETNSTAYACGHKNLYRLAQATLIHELMHQYDARTKFSSQKKYLKIAGFRKQRWGGLFPRQKIKNQLILRSPDSYEFENPSEHLAVNAEYYFSDPDYECRRPSLHSYLTQHFGISAPFAKCDPLHTLYPHHYDSGIDLTQPIVLDPTRIFQIHYLLAAGTPYSTGSQWGHTMLRIVGCAPGKPVDESCLLDLEYHFVVSFSAFIDESQMSRWKGFTGQYPSRVFIYPLKEAIQHYTFNELRDVLSIPLQLKPTEQHQLINRLTELYWEYKGLYYFLTNNCSSETLHLLKAVVEDLRLLHVSSYTPLQLLEKLRQLGILNAEFLDVVQLTAQTRENSEKIQELQKKGYYFKSESSHIQEAFSFLKNYETSQEWNYLPWTDLSDYIRHSSATERNRAIASLINSYRELNGLVATQSPEQLATRSKLLNHFLLLERVIQNLQNQELRTRAFHRLQQARSANHSPEAQTLYEENKTLLRKAYPHFNLIHGYGIPLKEDFDPSGLSPIQAEPASPPQTDALPVKSTSVLQQWVENNFPEEHQEGKQIETNLRLLLEKLGIRPNLPSVLPSS